MTFIDPFTITAGLQKFAGIEWKRDVSRKMTSDNNGFYIVTLNFLREFARTHSIPARKTQSRSYRERAYFNNLKMLHYVQLNGWQEITSFPPKNDHFFSLF